MKIGEVELESISNVYPKIYSALGQAIITCESPTANCQTYSLAGIDYLVYKDDAMSYFKAFQRVVGKNQILVDISKGNITQLEKIFPAEDFLVKSEYTNSTGSPMIMCLIKTTILR